MTSRTCFTPDVHYFQARAWMEKRNGSEFDEVIRKGLKKKIFSTTRDTRPYITKILKQNRLK